MSDHDALRDNAGAWVLGALDEDEAWNFAAHLDVCASCRAEVERLRVAVDALPLAVPQVAPPPALKTRLMAIVAEEAREPAPAPNDRPSPLRAWLHSLTARPSLAAAAACLLLVAGAAIGVAVGGGGDGGARTVALRSDAATARGVRAQLVQTDNGAELRVSDMPAPPPGRVYQVWLQRDGRAPAPDAVFTVDRNGRGAVGVLGDAAQADTVLVTDEPLGGSTVPTRQPVLRGQLA